MVLSHRSARWLILICVAAIPFEILISVARHQLALRIGPLGYLLHPAFGIAIGCLILQPRLHIRESKWFLALLAIYATGIAISGAINGSLPFYVLSALALGPLFMALVIVVMIDDEIVTDAARAFLIGVSVWSVAFFIFYLWNARIIVGHFPVYWSFPFGKFMMALRSPGEDLWRDLYYFKLLGNFNKQANILSLSLILGAYLYSRGDISFRRWVALILPISVMLFLMFSRGAFVALALFSVALASTSFLSGRPVRHLVASAAALVIVLLSFSTAEWRDYWRDKGSIAQRETMATSAFSGSAKFLKSGELAPVSSGDVPPSLNELCKAKEPERTVKLSLFGYGVGKYGPTICRGAEAESHNAFVDAWIQGGVIGFIGYAGLFLAALIMGAMRLFRSRFKNDTILFGIAIVGTVAILAMREYALVYLWVQSAGGFLLALGLSLILARNTQRA